MAEQYSWLDASGKGYSAGQYGGEAGKLRKWSRSTVADGKWLNRETIEPFSGRDQYLLDSLNQTYDECSAFSGDLQDQIDVIEARSDVVDVVGTYADFSAKYIEHFDPSMVSDNDVVKILKDEEENNAQTYYRWLSAYNAWDYVGQVEPHYYTATFTTNTLEVKNTDDDRNYEIITDIDRYIQLTADGNTGHIGLTDEFISCYTALTATSGNWNSVYDTVCANSANWSEASAILSEYSGNWQATYSAVSSNSASWNETSATLHDNSGKWEQSYTALTSTSSYWNSVYSSVLNNSASWNETSATLHDNSGKWESVYSSVSASSGNWDSTSAWVYNNSANIVNASATLNEYSGKWNNVSSTVYNNSGNWQDTYSAVSSNSAIWNETAYVPLSAQECLIGSGNKVLSPLQNNIVFIQGRDNSAYSWHSFAQGQDNLVNETNSFAQGYANSANDGIAFAQGEANYASTTAIAIGQRNSAYNGAVAFGKSNNAKTYSMAEGNQNIADRYSMAEGFINTADRYSIAAGLQSFADDCSQAFGDGIIITNSGMGIGTFNKTSADAAFVIGNGTDNAHRSDLYLIDHNGNVSASGNVSATNFYINGSPLSNNFISGISADRGEINNPVVKFRAGDDNNNLSVWANTADNEIVIGFAQKINLKRYSTAPSYIGQELITLCTEGAGRPVYSANFNGCMVSAYANGGGWISPATASATWFDIISATTSAVPALLNQTFSAKGNPNSFNQTFNYSGFTLSAGTGIGFYKNGNTLTVSAEGTRYSDGNYIQVDNTNKQINLSSDIVVDNISAVRGLTVEGDEYKSSKLTKQNLEFNSTLENYAYYGLTGAELSSHDTYNNYKTDITPTAVTISSYQGMIGSDRYVTIGLNGINTNYGGGGDVFASWSDIIDEKCTHTYTSGVNANQDNYDIVKMNITDISAIQTIQQMQRTVQTLCLAVSANNTNKRYALWPEEYSTNTATSHGDMYIPVFDVKTTASKKAYIKTSDLNLGNYVSAGNNQSITFISASTIPSTLTNGVYYIV